MPFRALVRLVHQVAVGLRNLHAVGLVHRDLKLDNNLLDCRWNAMVADLGLGSSSRC